MHSDTRYRTLLGLPVLSVVLDGGFPLMNTTRSHYCGNCYCCCRCRFCYQTPKAALRCLPSWKASLTVSTKFGICFYSG